jgi:hypothetical protein
VNGYPPNSDFAGASILIWLELESYGRFKFRIKEPSSNQSFNQGIENYLKQLQRRGLDRHKNRKAYSFNITIEAT